MPQIKLARRHGRIKQYFVEKLGIIKLALN